MRQASSSAELDLMGAHRDLVPDRPVLVRPEIVDDRNALLSDILDEAVQEGYEPRAR